MARWVVCLAALICFAGSPAIAGELDLKEGQWEITVKAGLISARDLGRPGTDVKSKTKIVSECLSREAPAPSAWIGKCEVKTFTVTGNEVTYETLCNTPSGPMAGNGKVTYSGSVMSGRMEMRNEMIVVINLLSGKRVGDCTK